MIALAEISTKAPEGLTKSDCKRKTDRMARRIADLQHVMYAEKKHSLLVVLQGMDASGKDGATRKVFAYCTPTGINAYPFRKPTEEEFAHDFLWRIHRQAPAKGHIKVFIRSHYEDILIQRVHHWIDEDQVKARMAAINAWEQVLTKDNQTTLLKFYLHISPEHQKVKLQERIDNPRKQWKHNSEDWKERELWEDYRQCYEYAINESEIPWIVAPADKRWYRDYFIAEKVLETLEAFDMKLPTFADMAKTP
jgi:PPK2 family polyphosphate:nucleotide phosphotransferase